MVRTIRPVCAYIAKTRFPGIFTSLQQSGSEIAALCTVVSCAVVSAKVVYADFTAEVNSPDGNMLNPSAADTTRQRDVKRLSNFHQYVSRTPSGLLYKTPFLPAGYRSAKGNWFYRGSLEFGYLTNDGNENAAEFNNYADWSEGPLLNFFDFSGWEADKGYFADVFGGAIGRDDQYYHFSGGQYGVFKINGFYSQIPRRYSSNALTIFLGSGTENLALPAGLIPGNNSDNQIQQALQSAYHPELGIFRDKGGVGIEFIPWTDIIISADFRHESRHGARPFGGSFFPPFYAGGNAGGVVETIEPIDYSTSEIGSSFSYTGDELQLNVKYTASFFSNDKSQLTFDNPFTNLPGTDFLVEQARIDLYPDNQFHQVIAELAYRLPLRGQLTSSFSWSSMRQDDDLLSPTINSGLTFTGIDMDQWNSINALPRQTADAEIDNLLFQTGIQMTPWDSVTLRTRFRYQNEDNQTSYTGFNPPTGQFGYIAEDGSVGGLVFQAGVPQTPIHYRSIQFAKRTIQWLFNTDYRVTSKTKIGAGYRYEQLKYDHRERDKTDENRLELYMSSRSLPWATLRLSYQYADRAGSDYNYDPYSAFYTSSLAGFQPVLPDGPTPHTLADLRKYDLSSRQQNQVKAQANILLGDTMDLLLSMKWLDNRYDARYGLQSEQTTVANVEWNYQPSAAFNSYAFYSYQNRNSNLANINDSGFSSDPNAGGVTFPFDSAWQELSDDNSHLLGVGLRYQFGKFDINSNYTYSWSRTRTDYHAASSSALANPEFASSTIGTGFPDIEFNRHILETSVRWALHDDLALRFYHRYEIGSIQDWHYAGLTQLIGKQLFLGATPQNYQAHLFGIFIQYRLK